MMDHLAARRRPNGSVAFEVLIDPPEHFKKQYDIGALFFELKPGEAAAIPLADLERLMTQNKLSPEQTLALWRDLQRSKGARHG